MLSLAFETAEQADRTLEDSLCTMEILEELFNGRYLLNTTNSIQDTEAHCKHRLGWTRCVYFHLQMICHAVHTRHTRGLFAVFQSQ